MKVLRGANHEAVALEQRALDDVSDGREEVVQLLALQVVRQAAHVDFGGRDGQGRDSRARVPRRAASTAAPAATPAAATLAPTKPTVATSTTWHPKIEES